MPEGKIIVFDGVCVLCSRGLSFVLKHDRRAQYRFAAMQTAAGQALLRAHAIDPADPVSFLLLDGGVAHTDSDAAIRVLSSLGGVWRLANLLSVIPRGVRDYAYRWLARNRYRVFGRLERCVAPSSADSHRFLH